MNAQTCISDADLARLWDGQLTDRQRQDFERHLASCPSCRSRWERMSAGLRRIDEAFGVPGRAAETGCPSDEQMVAYLDGALEPQERQELEAHLSRCARCRAEVEFIRQGSADYQTEGGPWWARYAARQVLALASKAPQVIDELAAAVGVRAPQAGTSDRAIELPALQPRSVTAQRLAAATGDGFSRQVLRQDRPAFELEVVQFGQRLRISVRALGNGSPYADCLAQVKLLEAEACRFSRVILVEGGQGQCTIEPQQLAAARPEAAALTARVQPLLTVAQLAEAGVDAYLPVLEKLLGHTDPEIRRHAVVVLARISGARARRLLGPLVTDPNAAVRSAVEQALRQVGHV